MGTWVAGSGGGHSQALRGAPPHADPRRGRVPTLGHDGGTHHTLAWRPAFLRVESDAAEVSGGALIVLRLSGECWRAHPQPVRDVPAPRPNPPRQRYLSHTEVLRLVEACAEPWRTLEALVHGTGMEISAALTLTRGDVDFVNNAVHARGTKSRHRDRVCYVMAWAWPYVERHLRTIVGDATPLFPKLDRWRALDAHKAACAAVEVKDYRLHDARHTYAVTAIKHGASLEHVAKQLGHGSTQMVTSTYGRYSPTHHERRAWERNFALAQEPAAARAV
jgi:integrase